MSNEPTNQSEGADASDTGVEPEADALELDNDQSEADDGQSEEDDELEEVEWGGKKAAVPKWLKPGLMMQADYTRKTQEAAEQRRAFEAEAAQQRQAFEANLKVSDDVVAAKAEVHRVTTELAEYRKLTPADWQTLRANPDAYQAHRDNFEFLKDAELTAKQGLEEATKKAGELTTADEQQRRSAAEKVKIELGITTGSKAAERLVTYCQTQGFSQAFLAQVDTSPELVKVLADAALGHEAKQTAAKVKRVAQGQATAPATQLRGSNGQIMAKPDTDDFAAFERYYETKAKRA